MTKKKFVKYMKIMNWTILQFNELKRIRNFLDINFNIFN